MKPGHFGKLITTRYEPRATSCDQFWIWYSFCNRIYIRRMLQTSRRQWTDNSALRNPEWKVVQVHDFEHKVRALSGSRYWWAVMLFLHCHWATTHIKSKPFETSNTRKSARESPETALTGSSYPRLLPELVFFLLLLLSRSPMTPLFQYQGERIFCHVVCLS